MFTKPGDIIAGFQDSGRTLRCDMATVDPQDLQLPLRVAQVIRPSRPRASMF